MELFFFNHTDVAFPWVGAKTSLEVIAQGLHTLGVPCRLGNNIEDAASADFTVLSNICYDLNPLVTSLNLLGCDYGVIPFQEDYLTSSGPALAFFGYIKTALLAADCEKRLEALYGQPQIIRYMPVASRHCALVNHNVLQNARLCIANSKTEEKTIKRDCQRAITEVVPWTSGFLFEKSYPYDPSFLDMVGLPKGSFILQVGRFEPRKNQLASILATRHLDTPLVFIATSSFDSYKEYGLTCLEAISRFRQGPTIIISGTLPAMEEKKLKVISIDPKEGLSNSTLVSAYQNAGLYLHPAFYELPGYVNLEAAKLGTPCITGEWSTLRDYFTDAKGHYELDDRIVYACPYDINQLEKHILHHFGRKFPPGDHPAFFRTPEDVAKDFLAAIERHV